MICLSKKVCLGKLDIARKWRRGKYVSRWQNNRSREGYVLLDNSFGLGKFLRVQTAMSKKVFLQRTPRRQKKSILKVNLRHYKNFLDQNYWLMKRSPLYCGHFATLGHILRLFISVLGPFQRDGAKHPMKLIIISCQLQMLFHCSALHEQPQFKYKNIISNQ